MGLVEPEWMETILSFPKDVQYLDQVEMGTRLAKQLREEGADIVIAVTHSRGASDKILAGKAQGIDLILGGHDHDYYLYEVNGIPIVNSGSDFRQISLIKTKINNISNTNSIISDTEYSLDETNWKIKGSRADFDITRYDITSDITPDKDMCQIIERVSENMKKMKKKVIGSTHSIWDATGESCRTNECAVGNFVADLMRMNYNTDIAILQGGAIRSNDKFGPGSITKGDIMKMFPFSDTVVVFEIKGKYFRYL